LRLSRGERDDAALVVTDRDDQPSAKSRLHCADRDRAVAADEEKSATPQGLLGEFPLHQRRGQPASGSIGRADLELPRHCRRKLPLVIPVAPEKSPGVVRRQEGLMKMLRGRIMKVEELLAERALPP